MTPTAVADALAKAGRRDLARPYRRLVYRPRSGCRRREDVLAEVISLAGHSPDEVCRRLGMTPSGVDKALRRCGRPDLAQPFDHLHQRLRRTVNVRS